MVILMPALTISGHLNAIQCHPVQSSAIQCNPVQSVIIIKYTQLQSSAIKCNQLHSPAKPQGLSTAARRADRAGIEAQPSLLGNPSVDSPWFERRAERPRPPTGAKRGGREAAVRWP